jgi:hypothetical protein
LERLKDQEKRREQENHNVGRGPILDRKGLKTKRSLLYLKDPVRTAQLTLFISVIKTDQFMLYEAKVAVCSETNTKHTHSVRQNIKLLIVKTVGASHNQQNLRDYSEGHKLIEFRL